MPRRYVERESVLRSVGKALGKGAAEALGPMPRLSRHGTVVPHSWKLRYSANCTNPVTVFRDGVRVTKGKPMHEFGPLPGERPVMVEMEVPCRKCDACLKRRAAHWRLRAYAEYSASSRTWFGTLTLAPEFHYWVLMQCRKEAMKNGDDFDKFDAEQQFIARDKMVYREIKLYGKRLRKSMQSEASLRFLCITEAHKNGLPHYHMLVHEVSPADPIRHATLKDRWRLGFTDWKLVTSRASAGYVTKYLAKSMMARVRASQAYGETTLDVVNEKNVREIDPKKAPGDKAPITTAALFGLIKSEDQRHGISHDA